jgi:hypothetical protein
MIPDVCNLPQNASWAWFTDTTREDEAEDAARVVEDWEDGNDEQSKQP